MDSDLRYLSRGFGNKQHNNGLPPWLHYTNVLKEELKKFLKIKRTTLTSWQKKKNINQTRLFLFAISFISTMLFIPNFLRIFTL